MPKALTPFLFSLAFSAPLLASETPSTSGIVADERKIETVFKWSRDKCFDENIPDSAARAFRSPTGLVNLYATHYKNIPLVGSTLNDVRPECGNKFEAAMSSTPQSYNARVWLQTFYSTDGGKNIYSLASSDYHGRWFKNCDESKKKNQGCWWSAIVLAHSDDGGKSFKMAPPPNHIVARSPHDFSKHKGGPVGFLTTSNIVKVENYYYALFNVAGNGQQDKGNCIARTDSLGDPASWRAWNGKDYSQPLNGSRQDSNTKNNDSCKTLDNLPYKVRSLLWRASSHKYIAVFEESKVERGSTPRVDVKFSYSSSADLISWDDPREIMTLRGQDNCKSQTPGAYPSILDSNSSDENFGTVGNDAFLYYTKFNLGADCRLTLDRDLVRVPVKIHLD